MLKEVFVPVVLLQRPINTPEDLTAPLDHVCAGAAHDTYPGALIQLETLMQKTLAQGFIREHINGQIEKRFKLAPLDMGGGV